MIPLKLTGREQEFLAQLCSSIREQFYQQLIRVNDMKEFDLHDILDRFEITPTKLDILYDRLHRTGANS